MRSRSRRTLKLTVAMAVACGSLAVAPASVLAAVSVSTGAGTVHIVSSDATDDVVTVATSPGVVVVTNTDATLMTSSDPAECPVTASGHKVTCTSAPTAPYTRYRVWGGAGNDSLTVTGPLPGTMEGREGADTMSGGDGLDLMFGGDGVDVLRGNAGNDQLAPSTDVAPGNEVADGGPGDDFFEVLAGGGSYDQYLGGPGVDRLFAIALPDFTGSVFVNLASGALAAPTPGGLSDSDSVSGIEDLMTSQGADSITGSSGSDIIESSADSFAVLGAGFLPADVGDTVDPGAGVDTVNTGAGDDTVNSNDGFGDNISCGPGTDTVQADAFDTLTDCESVAVSRPTAPAAADIPMATPPKDIQGARCEISGVNSTSSTTAFFGGLDVTVACDESTQLRVQAVARVKRIDSLITAAVGEFVVAEASLGAGTAPRTVKLLPPKGFARSLGKRFTVSLRVEATDDAGNRSLTTKTLRVKAPKKKRRRQ
jgi:Ca2+-binding RTX toxin-like protein